VGQGLESLREPPDEDALWSARANGHSRAVAEPGELGGPGQAKAIGDPNLLAGPLDELLGLRTLEVEEGRVVVGLMPSDAHCSATGSVRGAIPAALLESAAACAVQTTLPAGCHHRTMGLTINVVRLVGADSRILCCEGNVVDRSSRVATVEGRVWADPGQRLVAHGKVTCLINPR
jgi:uncharacterized protein (TIGR00369 family)